MTNDPGIYVVVADNDRLIGTLTKKVDDGGPIALETYTDTATLDAAERRILALNGILGKCRIAKLVFIDNPEGNHE